MILTWGKIYSPFFKSAGSEKCQASLSIISRDDAHTRGYVSVFGNIAPRMSADLYKLASNDKTAIEARDLYHRVIPLMDAISGDPIPW